MDLDVTDGRDQFGPVLHLRPTRYAFIEMLRDAARCCEMISIPFAVAHASMARRWASGVRS